MSRRERGVAGLLAFGLVMLAMELGSAILRAPTLKWNEARAARSVALLHGFTLYPARDAMGPVAGTLHTPISHCLYLLTSWFQTPTSLMVAGSTLSVFVVFGSLGWVLMRAGGMTVGSAVAFLFCGFVTAEMPGTYYVATAIHTDAAALALATVACGIFCGRNAGLTRGQVWIAGAACAMVMGCKQTLAPLTLGLVLFLAVVSGWRGVARFLAAVAVTGMALLGAIAALVPLSAFLFNTVTLTAHRPLDYDALPVFVEAFRAFRLESLPALFPITALLADEWISGGARLGIRQLVRGNRWLAFVFAAACVSPVCMKATVTVGGDTNHLGIVLYLLFVGAALAIQQNWQAVSAFPRRVARVSAVVGIIATVAPGAVIFVPRYLRHTADNDAETAFRYVKRHGGETYFPWNPTATLLTSGKLYHFDVALFDRALGHAPLTPEQMRSGLPIGFKRVALPPEQRIVSDEIRRLVAGQPVVNDPELPGWRVFEMR